MTNLSSEFWMFTLAQTGAKPSDAAPSTGATTGTAASAAPGTSQPATQTNTSPGGLGGFGIMPFLLIAFLAVMIIPQIFAGKKEKKRKEDMLSGLAKGDRVLTIGGQIGTVDQVRDQEVVLRIDENSNVKARFTKTSIQSVLESASKPATYLDADSPTVEVKAKSDSPMPAR
jgi:preprotein translocase subunit YajC